MRWDRALVLGEGRGFGRVSGTAAIVNGCHSKRPCQRNDSVRRRRAGTATCSVPPSHAAAAPWLGLGVGGRGRGTAWVWVRVRARAIRAKQAHPSPNVVRWKAPWARDVPCLPHLPYLPYLPSGLGSGLGLGLRLRLRLPLGLGLGFGFGLGHVTSHIWHLRLAGAPGERAARPFLLLRARARVRSRIRVRLRVRVRVGSRLELAQAPPQQAALAGHVAGYHPG